MESYILITIKLSIGFLCLILFMNLSGKGNLAPMSAADQIQNYVLGGIVGGIIYSPQITIVQFVVVLFIWAFLNWFIRFLKLKNRFIKRFIDGERIIVVRNGKVIPENFMKAKLSTQTFTTMLRMKEISSIGSLKKAQIEQNGQLTVIQMDDEEQSYMVISDGEIYEEGLEDIGKDEDWLLAQIQEQGIEKVEDIFFAEYFKNKLRLFTY
ncbi:DUF421 domain-containing protein [Terrilactibacillus sp. BCM23-1]|uniref:DUF421 domain-containing protein n=1 Tax=Terrilactibacillus tamarindi TaxID=2599694 RepID=A0A6N8CMJ0_9BACI|nr:DUF421 domain-containing protein [Terrilactibacillus tamarindi]MTT31131.1 DUF421 domain-containing protein [Terrilactibacillus tamarindi]